MAKISNIAAAGQHLPPLIGRAAGYARKVNSVMWRAAGGGPGMVAVQNFGAGDLLEIAPSAGGTTMAAVPEAIAEAGPHYDAYWGIDREGSGQNKLGKIIERIRSELRAGAPTRLIAEIACGHSRHGGTCCQPRPGRK